MVTNTTMTPAALPIVSTPSIATHEWQMSNATFGAGATRVLIDTAAARYGTSGFGASAVVADMHSRQAKPAAPPRGSR
jgi:hypothetical protein